MASPTESAESDDWQLAALARNGDEAAYERIISHHQVAVHAFVFRYVGHSAVAQDLAQETFVRAWFALERARPRAKFTTWLFQIAVNLCRDHAKSKAGRQAKLSDSLVRLDSDGVERDRELVARGSRPDESAQFAELHDLLDLEIARLPIRLRESFILGVLEERTWKEVAEIVRATPKAVELRVHRARKILSERLASAL